MDQQIESKAEAELQLAALLADIPCSVAIVDRSLHYLCVSRAWEEAFNIVGADVIGRNYYDTFPDFPDSRREMHQRCLNGEIAYAQAEPFPWHDGTVRWLRWTITPFRNRQNAICGLVIIFEIVTREVQLESQLRRQDELYRTLVRQFPQSVVVVYDLDLRYILVEGAGLDAAQFSREDSVGKPVQEALSAHAAAHLIPAYQRALRGEVLHFEYLGRDAKTYFDVQVAPLRDEQGNIMAGFCVARDITLQKRAQQMLADSELRYRIIVEDQTELILRFDVEKCVTFANQAYVRYFGLDPFSAIGQTLAEQLPASVYSAIMAVPANLQPEKPSYSIDTKISEPGRKSRWLSWTLRLITERSSQALEYQAVARDITATKRAEKAKARHRNLSVALREIAVVLHGTLDLNAVLDCIMDTIDRVVPHPFANIMLLADDGSAVQVVRSRGYNQDLVQRMAARSFLLDGFTHLKTMLATCAPLVISTVRSDVGRSGHSDGIPDAPLMRSYVGAPIVAQGRVIGFISLESEQPNAFKRKHAKQLQAFTEHAALAIRNAQMHRQFQEMAVWEERQRIARELHDAVSQTLFSVNMIADALPNMWRRMPDQVPLKLSELRQQTQIALTEMRSLLFELRPQTIADIPLDDLIDQLVRTLMSRTSVAVQFRRHNHDALPLPEATKIALYRIVQEAVSNIIRHSRATSATIRYEVIDTCLQINIEDNGQGFDLAGDYPGHLGLRIMRERAEAMCASLLIESRPAHGTTVRLRLPLRAMEKI